MSLRPGYLRRAWIQWKALRLPWRKQWVVGADLSGNTFWVFKDALNSNRMRRIVRYNRHVHHSEVKISPQWHQWLRHTRDDAPSLEEQQYDVSRQAMMKQLAAAADERWKSVPSYLDSPNQQQPTPATNVKDPGAYAPPTEPEEKQGVNSAVEEPATIKPTVEGRLEDRPKERTREENPWQKGHPKGAPSEKWQPESWTPGVARRR